MPLVDEMLRFWKPLTATANRKKRVLDVWPYGVVALGSGAASSCTLVLFSADHMVPRGDSTHVRKLVLVPAFFALLVDMMLPVW